IEGGRPRQSRFRGAQSKSASKYGVMCHNLECGPNNDVSAARRLKSAPSGRDNAAQPPNWVRENKARARGPFWLAAICCDNHVTLPANLQVCTFEKFVLGAYPWPDRLHSICSHARIAKRFMILSKSKPVPRRRCKK